MSEQDTAATPPEDRAASLHAVARALRGRVTWGRRRGSALAEFLDALGDPETTAAAAPADMNRLTERATHLLEALQHQHDPGVLAAGATDWKRRCCAESEAPVAAGVFRRLLDVLANIGL